MNKNQKNRILEYIVSEENTYKNIRDFLKALGYSHPILTHLKRTENGIQKNGIWARVSDTIAPGDHIRIALVETDSSDQILPVELPFPVVYEDEDLLIVNKPAGMPIHPSQGNHENTLANAAAWYFRQRQMPFVYRCINRLDRDTTGLVILAKNMYSASRLSTMVKNREIHRQYLAVAEGLVPDHGIIDAPIGRVHGSTIEREVNFETGDRAVTHYARLDYKNENGFSLVSLQLETGRTHQIRVHMNYIGHPLPGDFIYNPDYSIIKRQALHSSRLEFSHPVTGEPLHFTAPLPDDMKAFGFTD